MPNNTKPERDFHIKYDPNDPAMSHVESLRQYMSMYSVKALLLQSLCLGAEILVRKIQQSDGQIFSNLIRTIPLANSKVVLNNLESACGLVQVKPEIKVQHGSKAIKKPCPRTHLVKDSINKAPVKVSAQLTLNKSAVTTEDQTLAEKSNFERSSSLAATELAAKSVPTKCTKYSDATMSHFQNWGT